MYYLQLFVLSDMVLTPLYILRPRGKFLKKCSFQRITLDTATYETNHFPLTSSKSTSANVNDSEHP